MFWVRILFISIVAVSLAVHIVDGSMNEYASTSRKIQVMMKPRWGNTPFEMEAAEFFNDDDTQFWSFVEAFQKQRCEKDTYHHLLDISDKILRVYTDKIAALAKALFKWSISLRYYSPLIASFHQVANETWFENTGNYIQISRSNDCPVWFVADGHQDIYCDARYIDNISNEQSKRDSDIFRQDILSTDHKYGLYDSKRITIILHGSFSNDKFGGFHTALKKYAEKGLVNYVFRPFDWSFFTSSPVALQGYGIEVAIKNTEYPVVDDSFETNRKAPFDYQGETMESDDETNIERFIARLSIKGKLGDERHLFLHYLSNNFKKISKEQLKNLGIQTVHAILNSKDPLFAVQTISQNYPSIASVLANISLDLSLNRSLSHLQNAYGDGVSHLFLNGRRLSSDDLNPHRLFSILHGEFHLFRMLNCVGLSAEILPLVSAKLNQLKKSPFRYRVNVKSDAVLFINDLETDAPYLKWPKSLDWLLYPQSPEKPILVSRNIYNVVFVWNPLDQGLLKMYNDLLNLMKNKPPIRFGFIFYIPGQKEAPRLKTMSNAFTILFDYLKNKIGPGAVALFDGIWNHGKVNTGEEVTIETIMRGYAHVYSQWNSVVHLDVAETVLKSTKRLNAESAESFVERVNVQDFPTMFFNGQPFIGYGGLSQLYTVLQRENVMLGDLVRSQRLIDGKDPYTAILSQPGVYRRMNTKITHSTESDASLNFAPLVDMLMNSKRRPARSATSSLDSWEFIQEHNKNYQEPKFLSVLICSDLEDRFSIKSALHVLTEMDIITRLAFLPISASGRVPVQLQVALRVLSNSHRIGFAKEYLEMVAANILDRKFALSGYDGLLQKYGIALEKNAAFMKTDDFSAPRSMCSKISGESTFSIIVNGRALSYQNTESLEAGDFRMIQDFEFESRAKYVKEVLDQYWVSSQLFDQSTQQVSNTIMYLTSTIWWSKYGHRETIAADDAQDVVYESQGSSILHISGIINPLSRYAQKASPVLTLLRDFFRANIKIYWNPSLKLSEKPLKTFYRFVVHQEPQFDRKGSLAVQHFATFEGLPEDETLTLNIDVMESWMVGIKETKYDLDNIVLKELPRGTKILTAVLELENILITGRCYDQFQKPPRGLPLALETKSRIHITDTTVMANLGYFQLQSNPGLYTLLLPSSQATKLYDISMLGEKHVLFSKTKKRKVISALLTSFLGLDLRLHAEKKPGMVTVEIAHDYIHTPNPDSDGVWSSLQKIFTSPTPENKTETVHIFSVASGHLYERFLRIMMLSVSKNTKNPVKFWILKNYLSPRFKYLLPTFSKRFKFDYELVTYKWPHFLNKQTEKHRVIWGSKVLFLDVLFPLNVPKIIFVDADQVARSDLAELYFMDLQDKPLAYTPFCKSRSEMSGYQFWNSGFWANHLQGKPYHISALYVVDLHKFRKMAAGDRFRVAYEQLSYQAHSLANLDQDLPNYMQHQIPIFSLPQEWLWCESWCSDEDKSSAKTIDLCNNPATKEPKLNSARRIIREWADYDGVLSGLEREIIYQ